MGFYGNVDLDSPWISPMAAEGSRIRAASMRGVAKQKFRAEMALVGPMLMRGMIKIVQIGALFSGYG